MSLSPDPRLDQLRQWVLRALDEPAAKLERASEDASFRRYFRVRVGDRSWIAMDAPPEREDCTPFVKVAQLMRDAGVHVPAVIAQDIARGVKRVENDACHHVGADAVQVVFEGRHDTEVAASAA